MTTKCVTAVPEDLAATLSGQQCAALLWLRPRDEKSSGDMYWNGSGFGDPTHQTLKSLVRHGLATCDSTSLGPRYRLTARGIEVRRMVAQGA